MRRLRNWSITLGTLAFISLPLLAAGCADNQATSTETETTADPMSDMDDLPSDLGAPAEAGSELGLPEAGSSLE